MQNKKVLIVEDESIIALDLKTICYNLGYDCKVIKNGDSAVKQAGEAEPDLILMDLETEGKLDIVNEAEKICNKFKIPIIFFTRADPISFQNHKMQKRCEFLPIPFNSDDIKNAILKLLSD